MKPIVEGAVASLLSAALVLPTPAEVGAQIASARPASVSLTVVVPPRGQSTMLLGPVEPLTVVRRSANAMDVEASIDLGGRPATRTEVSLGRMWRGDSTRVWVRNSRGDLERLVAGNHVIALDRPTGGATEPPAIQFFIEGDDGLVGATTGIPLEYRIRVPSGDAAATWTFATVLRVGAAP
ncbi:MAG TPA: hypothetical protein VFZ21_04910 [Gemmatimonadaceae bacterium]|jgi:hypothetical protein|nr:hypothetical protein [Gemmatimonadaceae bacterium]